jgi:hypothetical protein
MVVQHAGVRDCGSFCCGGVVDRMLIIILIQYSIYCDGKAIHTHTAVLSKVVGRVQYRCLVVNSNRIESNRIRARHVLYGTVM